MSRFSGHFWSKEERARHREEWIAGHYLEKGRRYTFEVRKRWVDGYTALGLKRMRWSAYIKQMECPWMGCAVSPYFRTKFEAERWAREYLRRGGPPEGYFDPPPPDPNEIVFRGSA